MKYGIKDEYWKKLCELFSKKPKIEKVILYGSRAKGTYKPFSDIDITLLGDKLEHDDLLDIIDGIEDLLLPYMFDISLYSSLKNENLIEHINRVGVEIYGKRYSGKPDASPERPKKDTKSPRHQVTKLRC